MIKQWKTRKEIRGASIEITKEEAHDEK